jgi:hypothetical protein
LISFTAALLAAGFLAPSAHAGWVPTPGGGGTSPQPGGNTSSGSSGSADYPQSSAGQPGDQYPFRAEAYWTVYYDTGAGPQILAHFQKYTDLQLPVYDIQTIIID